MDEAELMRDIFEVEQDADAPGGGAAEVGEEDELVTVGLGVHGKDM